MQQKVEPQEQLKADAAQWQARVDLAAAHRICVMNGFHEGIFNHLTLSVPALDFHFGSGGISEARGLPMRMPRDHFGVIATRTLTVLAGSWRINTLSDDGIRVWMNDELVIDDWTHHAATRHHADFTVDNPRSVRFRVEYFELDGASMLTVELQPPTP